MKVVFQPLDFFESFLQFSFSLPLLGDIHHAPMNSMIPDFVV